MINDIEAEVVPVKSIKYSKNCKHQQTDLTTNDYLTGLSKLNLTDGLDYISTLKKLVLTKPNTNQTKVDFLKSEISSGRYEINDQLIAAKLMSTI